MARSVPLYDTYGLPRDFIKDAARDAGVVFDENGFERAMLEQKTRARASWKGAHKEAASPAFAKIAETFKTEKDFYNATAGKDIRVEAIIGKNGPVNELKAGESGEIVLDRTPIYAESGGQVGDTGAFYDNNGSQLLADVTGAYYPVGGLVAHKVNAKETLRVGDRISVVADAERRMRIMRNHSGTHLVHAALRNILGTHVKQAGSLNAPDRMRFDFSHFAHVDAEELRDIEQQVNDEIRHNTEVETNVTTIDQALASGALAFFGDKYPESNVRVVTIPDERAPRGFYSQGALRRDARASHRRHRRAEDCRRAIGGGGSTAHRGRHGNRRAGTFPETGAGLVAGGEQIERRRRRRFGDDRKNVANSEVAGERISKRRSEKARLGSSTNWWEKRKRSRA